MWRSLNRVQKQAAKLNFYDEIIVLDESYLTSEYPPQFHSKLIAGSRGYGYWSWKPYLIRSILSKINQGDVLQYMDVGCHLNPLGIKRLSEYCSMAAFADSGILPFQAKHSSNKYLPILDGQNKTFFNQFEYKYNKADLLNELKVNGDPEITHSPQIGATVIFLCKKSSSIELVNEWIAIIEKDFKYIDNSPSSIKEHNEFIEHRHDQAIFSILCKKRKIETISALEYYYPKKNSTKPDWSRLKNFPIHAKRDKDLGFFSNSLAFLKRGLRKLGKILNE